MTTDDTYPSAPPPPPPRGRGHRAAGPGTGPGGTAADAGRRADARAAARAGARGSGRGSRRRPAGGTVAGTGRSTLFSGGTLGGSGGSRSGGSGGRPGRGRGRRAAPADPRKRLFQRIALGTALVLVLCTLGGWLYIRHLDGNLRHTPLSAGNMTGSSDGALNILLLGSDSRNSSEDLKLGGAKASVGGPVHADVEMLLHVSADRSNASLLSIPRDTMVDIPACKDPQTGKVYPASPHAQITDSLSHGGPGCTVDTWNKLTGIHIDHYMLVDFSGVVSMADAVGGVPVCVDANVHDPDSHLRLSKGTHVIKGVQALEWLRTRHGFGDGSDLYRTQTEHMYLTALMRKLKSAGTLTDPAKLASLAEAATKALTVDDGLDSVSRLVGLGEELKGVDLDRMTTVTMPYAADPANPDAWVIPKPGDAQHLFTMIKDDVPLDAHGKAAKKSTAAAKPSVSAAEKAERYAVQVQVENGSSTSGRAGQITQGLKQAGFALASNGGNAPHQQSTTTVVYPSGDLDKAQAVATALQLPKSAITLDPAATMTTVVIGSDWPSGTVYSPAAATPAAGSVPSSAPKQTGDQSGCAHVNPAFTY